jgi:hypothetical protein
VEEIEKKCFFSHVLEDLFAVWLETMISDNVFEIVRFKFIYNFLVGLSMNKFCIENFQIRRAMNKMKVWMH